MSQGNANQLSPKGVTVRRSPLRSGDGGAGRQTATHRGRRPLVRGRGHAGRTWQTW